MSVGVPVCCDDCSNSEGSHGEQRKSAPKRTELTYSQGLHGSLLYVCTALALEDSTNIRHHLGTFMSDATRENKPLAGQRLGCAHTDK